MIMSLSLMLEIAKSGRPYRIEKIIGYTSEGHRYEGIQDEKCKWQYMPTDFLRLPYLLMYRSPALLHIPTRSYSTREEDHTANICP